MIQVKLKEISPAGARVMNVKTKKDSFLTMHRVLTSTEMNYNSPIKSAKIPIPKYLDTKIFEFRKFYTSDKIKTLYQGDKPVFLTHKKELRPSVIQNNDKLTIFRPITDFSQTLNWKDLRALIDLASHSGFNMIAIPDSFYVGGNGYEEMVKKIEKHIQGMIEIGFDKLEVMYSVDVRNKFENFKKKLELIKNKDKSFVNIENDYYLKYYSNYSTLMDFSKEAEKICIYGSNIPRFHRAGWRISGVNLYASFGQDIVSQGTKQPFISHEGKKSVHDDPKSKVRFFDESEDALIKRGEYNDKYGEELIYDSLPYCQGESVTSLINKYDNQMLFKIMKIIEFYASSKALSNEGKAVIKQEYPELMKRKGDIWNLIQSGSQRILPNF